MSARRLNVTRKKLHLAPALVVAVLVLGTSCSDSGTSGVFSSKCDDAFATIENESGRRAEQLLEATLTACETIDFWRSAWLRYPNTHARVHPDTYLAEACTGVRENRPVCRDWSELPT
jgi:hypothetical protein